MALDAALIAELAAELSRELTDGRIEKIQQPEKDLLLLTIRAEGENKKLLIRAAGPNARVHLTGRSFENPKEAPMFCMLLRKHMTGARVRAVEQPNGDRIIMFSLEGRNELGDSVSLRLVIELMGRAANVVLVDGEGRILDCLRRIPLSEHGSRALLPGLRYELPERPETFLRERSEGNRKDGTAVPDGPSVSSWLDERYGTMEQRELQRRRAQEIVRSVRRARDRQQRKLAAQTEELHRTEKLEETRQLAELLQANLYRVRRGDRVLECENYYEEGSPSVRIPLDPTKTPQQNLARSFREYRKLKGAKEHLNVLLADGEKQLDYLNSVLEELDRAETTRDLEEIRAELESTGWLRAQRQKQRKKQTLMKPSAPLAFTTPDGWEILVGRNNAQNDELTTRIARRTDYWFHVKNLHGSHVILRCEGETPSEEALRTAAEYAAYYSQSRDSGKIPVDYTMVRNVKKPSGALPGKVIYQNYQTLIVDSSAVSGEGGRP
ncbi:MAG: NFACT family protein [Oscillospiraceae bacterium]|nr:NFACT family protein [Oscillospiraceae bacterium]